MPQKLTPRGQTFGGYSDARVTVSPDVFLKALSSPYGGQDGLNGQLEQGEGRGNFVVLNLGSSSSTGSKEDGFFNPRRVRFLLLSAGSIVSALGYSMLQERVFNVPGFVFGGWMTFLTYAAFAVCGWAEVAASNDHERRASLKDYFAISLLAMAGMYFTNAALTYLNYTTRIVFKSCRVLPVMAFRALVVGARYSAAQYAAGATLVLGVVLFTLGDADGAPHFSYMGIVLMSIALVSDSITSNLEERQFFRIKNPCSHAEVMMYLSMFACMESFVAILVTGELWPAVEHSRQHPQALACILAFSVLGYVTVSLVLLLIKGYGATNAEVVKSVRKVCQVVFSFVVFPKPMSWKYVMGGALVALGLWWLQAGRRKHQPPAAVQQEGRGEAGAEARPGGGSQPNTPTRHQSPLHDQHVFQTPDRQLRQQSPHRQHHQQQRHSPPNHHGDHEPHQQEDYEQAQSAFASPSRLPALGLFQGLEGPSAGPLHSPLDGRGFRRHTHNHDGSSRKGVLGEQKEEEEEDKEEWGGEQGANEGAGESVPLLAQAASLHSRGSNTLASFGSLSLGMGGDGAAWGAGGGPLDVFRRLTSGLQLGFLKRSSSAGLGNTQARGSQGLQGPQAQGGSQPQQPEPLGQQQQRQQILQQGFSQRESSQQQPAEQELVGVVLIPVVHSPHASHRQGAFAGRPSTPGASPSPVARGRRSTSSAHPFVPAAAGGSVGVAAAAAAIAAGGEASAAAGGSSFMRPRPPLSPP